MIRDLREAGIDTSSVVVAPVSEATVLMVYVIVDAINGVGAF